MICFSQITQKLREQFSGKCAEYLSNILEKISTTVNESIKTTCIIFTSLQSKNYYLLFKLPHYSFVKICYWQETTTLYFKHTVHGVFNCRNNNNHDTNLHLKSESRFQHEISINMWWCIVSHYLVESPFFYHRDEVYIDMYVPTSVRVNLTTLQQGITYEKIANLSSNVIHKNWCFLCDELSATCSF